MDTAEEYSKNNGTRAPSPFGQLRPATHDIVCTICGNKAGQLNAFSTEDNRTHVCVDCMPWVESMSAYAKARREMAQTARHPKRERSRFPARAVEYFTNIGRAIAGKG